MIRQQRTARQYLRHAERAASRGDDFGAATLALTALQRAASWPSPDAPIVAAQAWRIAYLCGLAGAMRLVYAPATLLACAEAATRAEAMLSRPVPPAWRGESAAE